MCLFSTKLVPVVEVYLQSVRGTHYTTGSEIHRTGPDGRPAALCTFFFSGVHRLLPVPSYMLVRYFPTGPRLFI